MGGILILSLAAAAAAAAATTMSGCQAPPPAVTTNLQLPGEEPWRVLSQQEQRTIRRTMAAVPESHAPSPQPVKSDETRSETLRLAVERAANRLEMAFINAETNGKHTLYHLRTINDRPVRLWIDESNWPTLRAAARIGWIVDHGPLEAQLLDALDEALSESPHLDLEQFPVPGRRQATQ